MSKCGEVFDMMTGKGFNDTTRTLERAAREATYCENATWQTYRLRDPITATQFAAMREDVRTRKAAAKAEYEQAVADAIAAGKTKKQIEKITMREEKWSIPKIDMKTFLRKAKAPEGPTTHMVAANLCPTLASCIYSAISHHIPGLYIKNRFKYLEFSNRLPVCGDLRIRFRERAIRILPDERNPDWFKVEIKLFREPRDHRLVIPIKTSGKSLATLRWLRELSESRKHPSGGMISAKRRKGKLQWQISLSRNRYEGEVAMVKDPIPGRSLVIAVPEDRRNFLVCEVEPSSGPRPWRFEIEGHDLLHTKELDKKRRRQFGANYRQSPDNAAHGHGRNNVLRSKRPFGERYENRCKNWIENRTKYIVNEAMRLRCESVKIEKLTEIKDTSQMLLGPFQYFKFLDRLKAKVVAARMKFGTFSTGEMREALSSQAVTNELVETCSV